MTLLLVLLNHLARTLVHLPQLQALSRMIWVLQLNHHTLGQVPCFSMLLQTLMNNITSILLPVSQTLQMPLGQLPSLQFGQVLNSLLVLHQQLLTIVLTDSSWVLALPAQLLVILVKTLLLLPTSVLKWALDVNLLPVLQVQAALLALLKIHTRISINHASV